MAFRHRANQKGKAWGGQWQNALWAAQVVTTGWMWWDRLTPTDQEKLCRMVVDGADRFLETEVPYYKDPTGKVKHKMLEMQARHSDGRSYGGQSENSFASREEWFAAQIVFGYLGLWEKASKMVRFTNKAMGCPLGEERIKY